MFAVAKLSSLVSSSVAVNCAKSRTVIRDLENKSAEVTVEALLCKQIFLELCTSKSET